MARIDMLHPKDVPRYAIYLEAYERGVNPKTLVTARVWDNRGVRERSELFETLEDALDYARGLFHAA
jgi:hypothetical protein